jgi:hypothetical protein
MMANSRGPDLLAAQDGQVAAGFGVVGVESQDVVQGLLGGWQVAAFLSGPFHK